MSTNDYFSKTFRVTNSAVKLFNTIKPFHTHVLEVVEQYVFEETVIGNVTDKLLLTVKYSPKPDCDGEGWGTYYDNTFCGYDASKCCEPFTCTGGFGAVWDNHNLFAMYPIATTDATTNTIGVAGNQTEDTRLSIVNYVTANTIRVRATADQLALFTGNGITAPSHDVFELSPSRLVAVRSIVFGVAATVVEVDSKSPQDWPSRVELIRFDGSKHHVTILSTDVSAQGFVQLTLDPKTYTAISADSGSRFSITQTTPNAGTYALWSQVTSAPGAVPVIYSPTPVAQIVVPDTIDVRINGEFPSPVERDRGSLLLRTALAHPRLITIGPVDGEDATQHEILSSVYNATDDVTTITLARALTAFDGAGIATLRGYDGGSGYDGFASCSALTDTLLAPLLTESLKIEYSLASVPAAFRSTQSIMRFGAPYARTTVTFTSPLVTATVASSNFRFGALGFETGINQAAYPVRASFIIEGGLADGDRGDAVSYQYVSVGGAAPLGDFTLLSGTLPPGLTMNAAGLVTGNLTTGGLYTWTVGREDVYGTVASFTDTAFVDSSFNVTSPLYPVEVTEELAPSATLQSIELRTMVKLNSPPPEGVDTSATLQSADLRVALIPHSPPAEAVDTSATLQSAELRTILIPHSPAPEGVDTSATLQSAELRVALIPHSPPAEALDTSATFISGTLT